LKPNPSVDKLLPNNYTDWVLYKIFGKCAAVRAGFNNLTNGLIPKTEVSTILIPAAIMDTILSYAETTERRRTNRPPRHRCLAIMLPPCTVIFCISAQSSIHYVDTNGDSDNPVLRLAHSTGWQSANGDGYYTIRSPPVRPLSVVLV